MSLLRPSEEVLCRKMPGLCLILDTSFVILAQNDAHCLATMTRRENTIGKSVFEVFPDNPGDSSADGVSDLRRSLITVLKTRAPDTMPLLRYAIARKPGQFEQRWWRVVNTPILNEDGFVRLIVNHAQDVTGLRDRGLAETAGTP